MLITSYVYEDVEAYNEEWWYTNATWGAKITHDV
jgi:hypothetical protein